MKKSNTNVKKTKEKKVSHCNPGEHEWEIGPSNIGERPYAICKKCRKIEEIY